MMLRLFPLALYLLTTTSAWAHNFYDPWCCNTTDCHAQGAGEFVELTADGWQVDVPKFNIHELVAFDDRRLRDTPLDEVISFHICIYAQTLRCFYRPGAGG